jgi:hypothetical protein
MKGYCVLAYTMVKTTAVECVCSIVVDECQYYLFLTQKWKGGIQECDQSIR